MNFPLLARLAEINERLRPLLDELGIKPKVRTRDEGVVMTFENRAGDVFSPVVLVLRGEALSSTEQSSWGQSTLRVEAWEKVDVGDNGWSYYHFHAGQAQSLWLSDDIDETFRKIGIVMRRCGVILGGDNHPKHTRSPDFAQAYLQIDSYLRDSLGDAAITCERMNGVESINFNDQAGGTWRVAFEGDKANIYCNSEKRSSFASDSSRSIAKRLKRDLAQVRSVDAAPTA